ncbi:MAG: hypothetical protein HOV80_11985 [Polyangiaceae bacterium]|nr:hypothetical protein [Polyangiaceae bacterium]
MRDSLSQSIRRALKGVGPFSKPVADAVLEVAYLTMAVDEELRDEELEAFALIAGELVGGGEAPDSRQMAKRLDGLGQALDKSTILERLEKTAATFGDDKTAKLAAYRVATLMANIDLDAADREFEFDLDLIATLGLAQEEADTIADEVNTAITPE